MQGEIVQVSLSKGGLPKLAVGEAWAGRLGLAGDVHNHTKYHGGPLKALLLVSMEDLEELQKAGFSVGPGSLGENLTVRGIDFRQLRAGQRFRVGDVFIELTKLREPCHQLEIYNDGRNGHIQGILKARHALGGFYSSVLSEGRIQAGDRMELIDQSV
jgi:MOSC domain-containing protein YiiM